MTVRTLLYADDDENDVFLVDRAFKKAGVSGLRAVANGRAALDYLRRAAQNDSPVEYPVPYLVLLDQNMPFLTGIEVLAWIRDQPMYATLPVFMFTSSNQDKDIAGAYAAGATGYLIKPGSAEKLVELARIIGRASAAERIDPLVIQSAAAYQPRPAQTSCAY